MTTPKEKIDSGKTMAEMWQGFAELALSNIPPTSIQYIEMQKAFYAGALCLFNWFMVQMDEDAEPTEADLDRVSVMHDEINDFMLRSISGASA